VGFLALCEKWFVFFTVWFHVGGFNNPEVLLPLPSMQFSELKKHIVGRLKIL